MSCEADEKRQDLPNQEDGNGNGGEATAAQAGEGGAQPEAPPYGWYYFGPDPWAAQGSAQGPAAASGAAPGSQQGPHGMGHGAGGAAGGGHPSSYGAPGHGGVDDNAQFKEAFDRLSRGDLSADTISKLLGLDDREFWKGALVGAAGALLLSNMPAIKTMFAGMAQSGAGPEAMDEDEGDSADGASTE